MYVPGERNVLGAFGSAPVLCSPCCGSVLGAVGGNEDGGGKLGLFWEGCSSMGVIDCSWVVGSCMFWELGEEMFREVGMFMLWASLLSAAITSICSADGVGSAPSIDRSLSLYSFNF